MKLQLESLVDGKFSKKTKGSIILIFLAVPFISSVISMIHVVKFLSLGNTYWVSITLAITYEIANLTILMAMVLMKKLRAFFVWACFVVLLSVQIIGNVYYSYDFISVSMQGNPGYLTTFISFIQEMIEFESNKTIIFTLACFLGLPIPMVSLFLVKSVVDYLDLSAEPEQTEPIKEVVKKFEPEVVTITKDQMPPQDHGEATQKFVEELRKQAEQGKDIVQIIDIKSSTQEQAEEHKSNAIDFSDTEKLVDEVQSVIENTAVAENSSEVIHTEEKHEPVHIGVTIKPQDDNNGEHRG